MNKFFSLTFLFQIFLVTNMYAGKQLFIEAENFSNKGGWVVDQQFMDLMGSSYLMAHGMGTPVDDAWTEVIFPAPGIYNIFVRTYNWTAPWYNGKGPGKFQLLVNGQITGDTLGIYGTDWIWQYAGKVNINDPKVHICLHDLSGFNGRCDAIYFTSSNNPPPDDLNALSNFRRKHSQHPKKPEYTGDFDFVIIGGGIAGTCAAISAARLGLKTALIQDRPVLGGNNSSEVRVHLGGRINQEPFPELGNIVKEIGPSKGGNAKPASYYEDDKKLKYVAAEPNIRLFLNYRAYKVLKKGNKITGIYAKHIESGKELFFKAPLFADCTGDANIGFMAGADYSMGREGQDQFGEKTAPPTGDKMTMGSSVQWYSIEGTKTISFPEFNYGMNFNEENSLKIKMGEWKWETGMNYDQINDFERIRDYGLLVVYSNWSYIKNYSSVKDEFSKSKLDWVAYIAGKRESRRLIGDFILKEQDITDYIVYPDGSAPTTWTIDLHYPDPKNSSHFPGQEFIAISKNITIHPYPIPYRCFYSRNIENLFMAGRNISVSHVALGTVRVMRTTGMMGEVVGMAAYLCKKHTVMPRAIYTDHLQELKELMYKGVGKYEVINEQNYNLGNTLGNKKH